MEVITILLRENEADNHMRNPFPHLHNSINREII